MSDFLKFAFELIAQVVYNLSAVVAALIKLFFTGWLDYFTIFRTYFGPLNITAKILAILLMIVMAVIPILILVILVR